MEAEIEIVFASRPALIYELLRVVFRVESIHERRSSARNIGEIHSRTIIIPTFGKVAERRDVNRIQNKQQRMLIN